MSARREMIPRRLYEGCARMWRNFRIELPFSDSRRIVMESEGRGAFSVPGFARSPIHGRNEHAAVVGIIELDLKKFGRLWFWPSMIEYCSREGTWNRSESRRCLRCRENDLLVEIRSSRYARSFSRPRLYPEVPSFLMILRLVLIFHDSVLNKPSRDTMRQNTYETRGTFWRMTSLRDIIHQCSKGSGSACIYIFTKLSSRNFGFARVSRVLQQTTHNMHFLRVGNSSKSGEWS